MASAAAMLLGGCGMSSDQVRQHMNGWVGQTDTALTGTFGVPEKTLDMAGGNKVYHYEFDNGRCMLDFGVDSKQVVTSVQTSGSDVGDCPRKLPAAARSSTSASSGRRRGTPGLFR